jgi:tRNA threonylcarbamoyladenosine biosynthesis protein TsaE
MIQNMKTITTNSFSETQKFAEDYARSLKGGQILCLFGDLGYGKTTFVQGLAKGLGITGKIISPTFIIMRSYKITDGVILGRSSPKKNDDTRINSKLDSGQAIMTAKTFYHIDLYRINNEEEIIDLGLLDILSDSDNVVAIEWPEKMGKLLPEKRIDVRFEYIDENKRKIVWQKR